MSHRKAAVETFELTRDFNGLRAVNKLNLQIEQGEFFALLGPNGAGKTTTINLLCCLLRPTSGTAKVAGFDIRSQPREVKYHIGVSTQETVLSEKLNAWENLALFGHIYGLSGKQVRQRSEQLLEQVGLLERAKDQVKKYSGGMRRRLNIVTALIHDPEVLFLDEPTLGLDPQARRAIWEYISDLKGRKTILLTTHYMEEADFLSDRVAIIDRGRIVALGTPEELKSSFVQAGVLKVAAKGLIGKVVEELRSKYRHVEENEFGVNIVQDKIDLKEVVDFLYSRGIEVVSASREGPTLEDVFLHLTGKKLRE